MARASEQIRGTAISARMPSAANPPQAINDPSIVGKLLEAEKWISVLESRMARTREAMFGESAGNALDPEPAVPSSVDALSANICTRAASLCGDIETINQRLGARPE